MQIKLKLRCKILQSIKNSKLQKSLLQFFSCKAKELL